MESTLSFALGKEFQCMKRSSFLYICILGTSKLNRQQKRLIFGKSNVFASDYNFEFRKMQTT